jgi:multidrug efflux pump subunit AcrB/ABC-type multidrug transport system ATPase subunit
MIRTIIQRKTLVSMLFLALVLLGIISYTQLPVELLPNAELPMLIVQVMGSRENDPEYTEKTAVIPLEGAISTLEGIDRIESFIEQRRAIITVFFNPNTEIKYAFLKLQDRISALQASLQPDYRVFVFKIDTEQLVNRFMTLEVRGTGGLDRIRNVVEQDVMQELSAIDGMANVEVAGGHQKSIEITLDEQACNAHDITPNTIRSRLVRFNAENRYVGQIQYNESRLPVNVSATYDDLSGLGDVIVKDEGFIRLDDIARIAEGTRERTSISRINGMESITVTLVRDSQSNLIQLAQRSRKVIDTLNKDLRDQNIEIHIQSDSAAEVERNIDMVIDLALFGGLLAVVILWIFLRNLRLVLIIGLAIPISVMAAFNFFYGYDISINSLTLVGIALAIGMLLDNSVVVLENIYRSQSSAKDQTDIIAAGTKQVWRSIFAATLTTITVFVPFVFSENYIIGILGRHIGVSIISTLLISLLVALILIPMLAHKFLRTGQPNRFRTVSRKMRLLQIYTLFLKSALRFPARTLISVIVLFFLSLLISISISIDVPEEKKSMEIPVYLTMPAGSTLESTDLAVTEIEERVRDLEDKEDILSTIYEQEAVVTLRLVEEPEQSLDIIKKRLDERLKNYELGELSYEQPIASQRFGGGGFRRNPGMNIERLLGIGSPEERIVIKGRDFDLMRLLAEDIQYQLEEMTHIDRANISIERERPEIHIHFDRELLSVYNIPVSSIASELSGFESEITSQLNFKQGNTDIDIIIKNEDLEEKSIEDLKEVRLPSPEGGVFPLHSVSRIVYGQGRPAIYRVNQERQIELSYRFNSNVREEKDFLTTARNEVDALIANMNIPTGLAVNVIHDDRDLSEFYFLLSAAFILIFMILASVFESLFTPWVMMFTIPLAAMGSFWALILTQNSILDANTLIGFLILLGVVVNNGIIFIDYTRLLRKQGFNRSRALITAGQARVRPILITSLTTMIAMLPLAMGKAEYVSNIGAPFAITVIGGLLSSTLFTLVIIPTTYSGLESASRWLREQSLLSQIVQSLAFALLVWVILSHVDSVLFRSLDLLAAMIIVPAMAYFIQVSLKRASESVIDPQAPLTIEVRNLVKIYDSPSRFVREWHKGKQVAQKLDRPIRTLRDADSLLWQLVIFGFLVYFIYFYLDSFFYKFVLVHLLFIYGLYLLKPIGHVFGLILKRPLLLWNHMYSLFYWGFPVVNILYFGMHYSKATVTFIALLWLLMLSIYASAEKLAHEQINIARIQGRFAGLRMRWYQLVRSIPWIGRRKNPFRALDRISLEIGNGMFGLLGPNGAGKTTLMRIICGILEPNRGKISINGIDLQEKREELQGLIGYLPQEFGTYENMTAFQYLDYQALLKGLLNPAKRAQRIQEVLKAVHLEEKQDVKIGSFSGGMKQRIGIAQTLLHLPRILVVDEPTAGLDPRERIRFRNLLVELSRNRIVIFSTHIIEDISSSCNRVAVLRKGELRYLGEPTEMSTIAHGKVWQIELDMQEFDELSKQSDIRIIHHMRSKGHIRVRCQAEKSPHPKAESVMPNLEDAYLLLIGQDKGYTDESSGSKN